jgi:hypothetical protein
MTRYEYKLVIPHINPSGDSADTLLNGLGQDGWRVISVVTNSNGFPTFILERLVSADRALFDEAKAILDAHHDSQGPG